MSNNDHMSPREITASVIPSSVGRWYGYVKIADIRIPEYQRPIDETRVGRITARFNPHKLMPLLLSKRADGHLYVIDGQHRMTALRRMSLKDAACMVLVGLTIEQEADLFRTQNDDVRTPSIYDRHHAGTFAGDAKDLELQGILDRFGYRAGRVRGAHTIAALSAMRRIMKSYGADTLARVLELTSLTWPEDCSATSHEMLAGLAEFVKTTGKRIPSVVFAERMSKRYPADILNEYHNQTGFRAKPQSVFNPNWLPTMRHVLVEEWNKGLGSTSRYRVHL
jgi:hypothetical protein